MSAVPEESALTITLETDRLLLRQFRNDDLDSYHAMVNHPAVPLALGDEPTSRERSWRVIAMYLGHWTLRGFGPFAVVEKASGALVGRIGPWRPEGWPGLELIWQVDHAHLGRGLATEAAAAARDFTYRALGDVELISLIEPTNLASKRVAEKLGAVPVREVDHDDMHFRVYRHLAPSA
jgi:RimJ/RimL family protein N-acetyltransferase